MLDGTLPSSIAAAVALLRRGGVVGLPTETVYGLAADAENEDALRKIFAIKGRPADHPLIVHIASARDLGIWASQVPDIAHVLAENFWPGPLTMLVRRAERTSLVATGGRETVAIRVPAHAVALDLLREFGGALAAPSANRFGKVSPTTPQHVLDDLGGDVDLILDGGECSIGVESTIVDLTGTAPTVLRPGGVSVERLESILKIKIESEHGNSRAPGMLDSHYAPRCEIELVESPLAARNRVVKLVAASRSVLVLDFCSDLDAYARHLYDFLRRADRDGCEVVVAVMPPAIGLGHAIRDRLFKASKHN